MKILKHLCLILFIFVLFGICTGSKEFYGSKNSSLDSFTVKSKILETASNLKASTGGVLTAFVNQSFDNGLSPDLNNLSESKTFYKNTYFSGSEYNQQQQYNTFLFKTEIIPNAP